MSELDELRTLIREVIRDVLPKGLPVTKTVNLSTDEDLAAFVTRLLDLDQETREDLRAGRKRFRLAVPAHPQASQAPSVARTASASTTLFRSRIKLVDYRMIGATGRLYLSGSEADVRQAADAAEDVLRSLT